MVHCHAENLRPSIREKQAHTQNGILQLEIARPYIARSTVAAVGKYNALPPPFSCRPGLAHSDCHLPGCLKDSLGGTRFTNDDAMKPAVLFWLPSVKTTFYHNGIFKLVELWQKLVAAAGDFPE